MCFKVRQNDVGSVFAVDSSDTFEIDDAAIEEVGCPRSLIGRCGV
jgi:hypothetical protein